MHRRLHFVNWITDTKRVCSVIKLLVDPVRFNLQATALHAAPHAFLFRLLFKERGVLESQACSANNLIHQRKRNHRSITATSALYAAFLQNVRLLIDWKNLGPPTPLKEQESVSPSKTAGERGEKATAERAGGDVVGRIGGLQKGRKTDGRLSTYVPRVLYPPPSPWLPDSLALKKKEKFPPPLRPPRLSSTSNTLRPCPQSGGGGMQPKWRLLQAWLSSQAEERAPLSSSLGGWRW